MPDMRRLAKRIFAGMPLVQAVILFGSRARGTARSDSDWDVALLAPKRYMKEVLRTAPILSTVNFVSFSPRQLTERCNRLGTLERSVVKDGVLLAGEWVTPDSQKKLTVSYPEMANGLEVAADHITMAASQLLTIKRVDTTQGRNTLCAFTQYAAERLSKAALLHLCIDPSRTHKVLKLADAIRKEHPHHPWIKIIESFNGRSSDHHVADYGITLIEPLDESLTRLYGVMGFYRLVLKAITSKRPGFSSYLPELCNNIVAIVSMQKSAPTWRELPEEMQQRLLQLNQMAEETLATVAGKGRESAD